MKAVFTRFFSVLTANTPPSEKGYSSRKFLSLFLILFLAVGNAWGQNEVTLLNTNFTDWKEGAAAPENKSLSESNTYTLTNGIADVADFVGKGCKLNDASNAPTAKGVEGYNANKFRLGSKDNFMKITPRAKFIKGGRVRILVSSEQTKVDKILGTVKIGSTDLGNLHGWTAKDICDWQEFDIPESIDDEIGEIIITRTDNTMFVWGIIILTNSSTPAGGADPVCPETLTISSKDSKTAFFEGDAIELTAALSEGNGAITYQWYKGGTAEGNKLAGKTAAKLEIASCAVSDAGDYYCVASKADCPDAVNTDAFTITITPSPCVTVTGADQFIADYTINGAYAINSGCATNNGALKIDNGSDFVEIYAPAGKKISLIEMSLYAGADKKVGYGFGASSVVDNDLMPWDWATKDVTGSYADYEFEPISSGKAKYFRLYRKVTVDAVDYGSGTSTFINRICVTLENTAAYTITYNANGGSGEMAQTTNEIVASTFTAPSGKMFKEWNTAADGTGTSYAAGDEVTDNLYLYAIWQDIQNFDVKFYPGYGENTQIGETQSVILDGKAEKPADPTREGYRFVGWSTDGTEAHIVDVATYGITAATNFTAMWKAVWTVTFDGAGKVEVQDGETVASPNSPVQAGKVFQGWYKGENKYDFSSAVAGNLALESKWAAADPNHYVYAYNDDFHFDGVVYKTPEGKVDNGDGNSNKAITTPYTLFAGAEGITSIVMTDGIYDSKTGAIQAVTALMKVNNNATSKLTVTINSGYTATLKIKSSGYSATRTINVSDATPASGTTTGQAVTSGAMSVSGIGELSFALTSGSHDLTVTGGTLYITELDIEATALPTYTVTYKPGEGSGAEFIIDDDATEVSDGSTMFTAPEGKIFNGWKDGDNNDVEVGAIVTGNMTLTAQWINHYAVTFNLQGHGDAIDPQDIKEGAKATKPTDPTDIGWEFGGWYTEDECTNVWDFATVLTGNITLYAKWTEFEGCAWLVPETSGDALHVGDNVAVQTGSKGATIAIVGMKTDGSSIAYSTNGLSLNGGGADVISVTLNSDMAVGTKISVTLIAANTGSRGVNLLNSIGGSVAGGTKLGWDDATTGAEATFSYTVTASDGLDGTNIFRLQRNNSVYLKCLKVESCGAAITYHNLTSEVNIAGKGTVTLGASSVREGKTTTAEYSAIDPLYEFVNWTVSGAGASVADATANPATITVGTEDAVVTLNLRLIPVKFTVNYFDGATAMGTEQVVVNEHPTASEIVTAKRGYVFEGWATSSTATASDVINLNTITSDVATAIPLYAIYTAVPCVSEGTVFSMTVTDPAGTQYEENNDFGLEIGATYLGGKAYSGSKSTTKRIGEIDTNGEYSFNKNSDVAVKVALDCALQEGDVIIFTTSTKRELKIKKVVGTDLVTTSSKKYTIPAESPLIGEYDFYLMRDNSESTFKTLKVERPYTISFDMQGHGDAIEAQKLIAGDKVVEPTAPTADGWDFKGWYKESACTNAWDFESDVVAGTMALYAKWDVHVTNDATLKLLKYGSEAIALADGVFEYNIGLPALTASVPTLTAVANSVTVHSLDIADAAEFDVDGKATSTVTVVSEDETVTNVYTVNFSKMAELPQVNVTESTTWNFSAGGSTTLTNQSDIVLANLPGINNDANFNSQALIGSFNKLEGTYFQGSQLSFTTEVAGELTITFRGTNNNERHLQVCVGDGETVVADWNYQGSGESAQQTQSVIVPAGKVTLKAFEGEVAQNARIYNMIFDATPDYIRTGLTVGSLGTICLPSNVPAGYAFGATFYELVGKEPQYGKIVFDEIVSGELQAGKPYLFQAQEDKLYCFYGTEREEAPDNSGALKGTFEDMTITDLTNIYYFAQKALWSCVDLTSLSVPANRAYVKMDEMPPITDSNPAPGRRRITLGVNGQQVATGMENVQGENTPTKMIINGQLFILRGEKMYDAQGKLVK